MRIASGKAGRRLNILLPAVVLTVLNSFKPLHVDDPFLYWVAEQIVSNPAEPYGFDVFWMQWPQPTVEELAPPVLPYWLAGGLALFGDRPFLWKLWLFPFALVLTMSLRRLFERFSGELVSPMVWLTVLSPTFLPGFNLMLDVPAVALGLGALVLFMRSCDRQSLAMACLAGLTAGLAMQTKYTALLIPVVMLLHAAIVRRVRLWIAATVVSLAVFTAWEGFVFLQHGQSMFLGQLQQSSITEEYRARSSMIRPLVMHLGGLIPALGLAGLTALGLRSWAVGLVGLGVVTSLAVIAYAPWHVAVLLLLGTFVCLTLLVIGCRVSRLWSNGFAALRQWRSRPEDWFLVLWLIVEIAGYFAIVPWPAARRVMGIVVVAAVLVGRLASQSQRLPEVRRNISVIAIFGAVLGLIYYAIDLREAVNEKRGAESTAQIIRKLDGSVQIWFVGHWGFQFYAERAGMTPVVPDHSQLRAGDYLVVPTGVPMQEIEYWNAEHFEPVHTTVVPTFAVDVVPNLSTIPGYYGRDTPLEFVTEPRLAVHVFRVVNDIVPASTWPADKVVRWTQIVGKGTAQWAVPALTRGLKSSKPFERRNCAQALGEIGEPARSAVPTLSEAVTDPDAEVRTAAADALQKITGRPIDPQSDRTPRQTP